MGLNFRNRFIRSATLEVMATPEGAPSPELKSLYGDLASGGVGLISTSGCLADRTWIPRPGRFLTLDSDDHLALWEDMVETVHGAGALISLQLGPFFYVGGRPSGPSALTPEVHALSTGEIEGLVAAYARAAERARKVGMDAVQVHGGHGYPLAQFLSPYFNRREDEYGGSHAKRARIFLEIRRAIEDSLGADYPVWIKMNSFDGIPGGIDAEDAEIYAEILGEGGYAAIEVTGGSLIGSCTSRGPNDKEEWREGFYLARAARVKAHSKVPVVAVGGIRRLGMVSDILSQGTADLIALSRPLIREPDLVARWASGDQAPSRCISCNGCFELVHKGEPLACVQEKGKKRQD
jgi:2,4-dienoyl-CoA reductase-like NADH-dependent reductase (Old Yellow Enzyme family)